MIARLLTTEEIRNCEGRNYNPQVWDKNIDRMLKYKDVLFYHVPKDDVYEYDRYFVEYTLPEGLRLFKKFSYSDSITSGGFYRLDKFQVTEDGRGFQSVMDMAKDGNMDEANSLLAELESTKFFDISYGKFTTPSGDQIMIGTNDEARNWMTEKSVEHGIVFTKG